MAPGLFYTKTFLKMAHFAIATFKKINALHISLF